MIIKNELNKSERITQDIQNNSKVLAKDILGIIILFLLSILFVYKIGGYFKGIFFLFLLYLSFRSTKDYFWFAFFFVLINTPAFFFAQASLDAEYSD